MLKLAIWHINIPVKSPIFKGHGERPLSGEDCTAVGTEKELLLNTPTSHSGSKARRHLDIRLVDTCSLCVLSVRVPKGATDRLEWIRWLAVTHTGLLSHLMMKSAHSWLTWCVGSPMPDRRVTAKRNGGTSLDVGNRASLPVREWRPGRRVVVTDVEWICN